MPVQVRPRAQFELSNNVLENTLIYKKYIINNIL